MQTDASGRSVVAAGVGATGCGRITLVGRRHTLAALRHTLAALRPTLVRLGLGCACAVTAVTPARAATPHPRRAGGATALLNRAFADARAEGSFHQSVSDTLGATHGTLNNDVSLRSGLQRIASSNGTRAQVLVLDGTAYVSGNQRALRSYFRFTGGEAAAIASSWLSIPSTSSAFAAISYDVTVPTALAEIAPTGHLTESAPRMLEGQRVIGISGAAPPAATSGVAGRATLYVTASSTPLPVRASMRTNPATGASLELTATMSRWGERVALRPPSGQVAIGQLAMLARLAIPGAPGYFTFTGQRGYPAPVGRPWGHAACEPVRFAAAPALPGAVYRQMASVIAAARRQGIDVTLESRALTWRHGSLYYRDGQTPKSSAQVDVTTSAATPPRLADGLAQHIGISWSTAVSRGGHSEYLTRVSGTLWLRALAGRPALLRSSIRQLIAWTQGISHTSNAASGISDASGHDGFTRSDVAAMLRMSGCAKPAGGGGAGGDGAGGGGGIAA